MVEQQGVNIHIYDDTILKLSATEGHFEVIKYFYPEVDIDKFRIWLLTKCFNENFPEDAEYIAKFLHPKQPRKWSGNNSTNFVLNMVFFQGSNYPPMDEEYKKRKMYTKG